MTAQNRNTIMKAISRFWGSIHTADFLLPKTGSKTGSKNWFKKLVQKLVLPGSVAVSTCLLEHLHNFTSQGSVNTITL